MKLLEFHIEIVQQICQENGLLVMGKGLGIERILCTILTIHTNPRNLILLLNCSDLELATLKKQLESASQILCSDLENEHVSMNDLKIINNETPAKERATLYFEGGVLAITSRILIVDILNHVIPTELVAGVIVNRAETVSETSSISFALRLYRGLNKSGFIRAFSESPQSFSGGLLSLETSLKTLQVRQIHLWPRFQFDVAACIDNSGSVELIEYRIGLTKRMNQIQVGLLDCITQSISELKRLHPSISSIDFTLENSLFKSFEYMIRKELDPIWHQASSKTKQIVQDLKTLRTLTHYLVSYDAVTFYSFLETIRAANSLAKTGGFRQNLHSWLLLDSANVVFACAKERVFLTKNQQPMIEEHPKWKALVAILREIEEERRASNRSFAGNGTLYLCSIDYRPGGYCGSANPNNCRQNGDFA
jgi:DNA excision repair protein ERCC-4